jgi:phosphate transport system substrate-binding protein
MKYKVCLSIFAILLAVLGCRQKHTTVDIAGSTTVLPIVQAAAEAYMDENPEINISVRGGGSGIGIKSAVTQTVDIGNASRSISKKEIELAKSESDLAEVVIARDAIVIVTSKENKIRNLSSEQLKAIYTGKITNWKEVGGKDSKIVVVSRDISSGSYEVLKDVVLNNENILDEAMKLPSNNAVAQNISYTKDAIGFIGLGYVTDEHNIVKINNVQPSEKSVKNDSYLLSRNLYMYHYKNQKNTVKGFIDYLKSPAGQKIVEQQGFISIN